MISNRVDIITMGCSKNLVDSELLMRQLEANGFTCLHDPDDIEGEYVVVNTCGFISDAKEESINMILELTEAKAEGRIGKLFVMGCLSQRFKDELEREIPEVDKYYGKFDYQQLVADLGHAIVPSCVGQRHITTPSHYAFVKISEGCDRDCAYCAIPLITGKHKSRSIEDIEKEVRWLVTQGVKEFQLIAQELTYYGVDIAGRRLLPELVDRLAVIEGVEWIRLHYAYPNQFPMELLDVMNRHDNVCKYLDIALQHVSDNVLSRMRRHVTKEETMRFISDLRQRVPDINLRTTLMVGFPGETEEDFRELLDFVKWARFERLGAFAYSEEEGTWSEIHYEDDIDENIKQNRLGQLMALQQDISAEVQAAKIGKTMKTIIDRQEGDYYVGRTQYSSPDVDPEVLIPVGDGILKIGHFYDVHMTDSDDFDLFGSVI
ncbi:MAG: 30S ribosomal protein S12 methylthiotransferase RimO [Prevotella sp.]|nr:30S ribosomal protein S12 methylthiotransferase RimO [Prevotella sp.]